MTSRRSVLAGLGVAAAGSLAGCGDLLGGGSDDDEPLTVDYRQWLVRPSVFDAETYVFSAIRPTPLLERADEFHDRTVPQDTSVPVIGVDDHEQVEAYVYFGSHGTAATGSFDTGPVVDALEQRGYRAADPIRGIDGYASDDGNAGVVDDGMLVLTDGENATRDRVSSVLATRDGERERYHETDDDIAASLEAVDDGQIVSVVGGALAANVLGGARAFAYSASLGDGDLTVAIGVTYPEGETDPDAVEDWVNGGSMFYGAEATTSEVGRAVRAETTVDLPQVTGFPVTTNLFPQPILTGTETPSG